jgi:hypothetical protein
VKALLSAAYARAKAVLRQHEKELHALAQVCGCVGVCAGVPSGVRRLWPILARLLLLDARLEPWLHTCWSLKCVSWSLVACRS